MCFCATIKFHGTDYTQSYQSFTAETRHVVGSVSLVCLFMGFLDSKKNIEYHQRVVLNKK